MTDWKLSLVQLISRVINESHKLVVTFFQNVVIKGKEQNHHQQQQSSLNGPLSRSYQIHSKQAEWNCNLDGVGDNGMGYQCVKNFLGPFLPAHTRYEKR